jgi:membrane-bound lytic murein transglycosylase A
MPLPRPAGPQLVANGATPDAKAESKTEPKAEAKVEATPSSKLASSAADAAPLTTGSIGASKSKRIVDVPLPKTRPDRRMP